MRREQAKVATKVNYQDSVDESVKQFKNVLTDVGIQTPTETLATDKPETAVATTETVTDTFDQAQYITRTINGKQVTKTLDEWLEAASKVEQADDYLQQAAQNLTRTNAALTQHQVQEEQATAEADDMALVQTLQMGKPEEAVAALRKLREQIALNARKGIEQTSVKEKGQVIFNKIVAENADLFNDQNLRQVAIAKDAELMKQGRVFDPVDPINNFELRFREAVRQTKEWYTGVKSTTEADLKKQELIEKKKALVNVTTNNNKVVPTGEQAGPPTFGSQEEYNRWLMSQSRFRKSRAVLN